MLKLLTLDSNVFISETKGDEEFSDKCSNIISRAGSDFLLVEPAILLAEIGNAIVIEVENIVSWFPYTCKLR